MGFRIVILTFAIFIDGLEMAVEAAMVALGSTGGGAIAGCALGAQYAGDIGCYFGGLAGGALGFLAQGTGLGEVLGALMGYVIDVGITFTFGAILLMFIICARKFKFFPTMAIFGLKLLPFLGVAPGWTWYAWHSTRASKAELESARKKENVLSEQYTNSPAARVRQMREPQLYSIGNKTNEQVA